jgi:NADH-quinone oxidoreductase subunit C
MTEQDKGEGSTSADGGETPQAAAPEASAATPPEPMAAAGEGAPAAKAERPAKAAEAKVAEKIPPPAGSIADIIRDALPDLAFEAYQGLSEVIVEISPADVPGMMPVLRDDPRLDLKLLRCLSGVDHEAEGMEVVYHLMSLTKNHEVAIKAKLPSEALHIASVSSVWNAANWHEREARDMFGIVFDGHPHLVPLLLPEDMTDHFPLRKDNLLAEVEEWQGERLGEDVGQAGHIPSGSRTEALGGSDEGAEE